MKKMIVVLAIILLIAVVALVIVMVYSNYQEKYNYDPPANDIEVEVISTLEEVNTRNNFYIAKSCVEKFYQYLMNPSNSGEFIVDVEGEEEELNTRKQAILDILDPRYIQYKNITQDNLFEQIQTIEDSTVSIENMYVSEKDRNMAAYIVLGSLRNNMTNEKTDFEILVEVDMLNRTFNIIMQDYIEEHIGSINIGQELPLEVGTSIEKNTYNTFSYQNVSEETYITDIFNDFKSNMMYDHEKAFTDLNEDYKNKRFTNYEEFNTYAQNNARDSLEMRLERYQITNRDGYTQYTCIDQNNNYYIFYVTGIMQYTVILDTYTLDLPEFIEEYNNATDAEKVILNIQKVFEAINDGDYRYAYNKLDETFKQSNFPTLESFEQYMEDTFYEKNNIGYTTYQTSGNLHIYEIQATDANNTESVPVTKNFIMQLLDGTNFVMSFNV